MTGCLVNHNGNFTTIPCAPSQRPQGSMLEEANIHVNRMARPAGSMLVGQASKLKDKCGWGQCMGLFPTDSPQHAVQHTLITSVPSESSHASIPGIHT